jgi:hypothetical protein
LEKGGRVVIILSSTISKAPGLSMQSFYNYLRPTLATTDAVSIFPSEEEHRWEDQKIGDIIALDEIARSQAALGNDKFAYRPRTCFGARPCRLADMNDNVSVVLKRSHSAASEHVKVTRASDRKQLGCYKKDVSELRERSLPDTEHIWFHQEYVEPLRSLGEFRVFIACDAASGKPRVVSVAHTRPAKGVYGVHALSAVSFEDRERSEALDAELKEFAMFIREQLLTRPDAQTHYESLRVGVRLDIGRSEDGRWFVNEVTRMFGADQFASYHLAYPHIDVAEAFAEALRRYLTG